MYIRIQVDMCAVAPAAQYNVELYNANTQDYSLDLVSTPTWRTQADIAYTTVSIPADARFTDLSGTGSESISPNDPAQRNGQPWFVFYRKDVFAAAKLPPPETMDDILHAAHTLNGSDLNGDGAAEYSVCFNPDPACVTSYFTFLGILGPMLQTAPSQGVFFQPDTMEPLVQNAAMDEALRIYANLSSYNVDMRVNSTCNMFSTQFASGRYCMRLARC
jgi:hypothetical protein